MKSKKILFMTQAAMIAAIYVVLTLIFQAISFGEIQVRIAEALTILPAFTPAAIPGLFIGCLIGNIIGGSIHIPGQLVTNQLYHMLVNHIYIISLQQEKVFTLIVQ